MGWQDAPEVQAPRWASAPEVGAAPPVSAGEAFKRGAMRGIGDRIVARAEALRAQQGAADPDNPLQSLDPIVNRPVDAAQFEADRARGLAQRRETGAQAEAQHPAAYLGGQLVPAAASMLIPGAATVRGAAAVGGALGVAGSESDNPAQVAGEGVLGAGLSGGGAKLLQLLGRGAGTLGEKLLPKAEALRDAIAAKVGDRSAAAAESTARSAVGTFGAQTAGGSADLKLLQALSEQGVSPETQAKIAEALAGPDAAALRESLAKNALDRLPGKLAGIEGGRALVEQTAADAAAARTPEALASTEKQMRRSAADILLKRYVLPAAVGAGVGELTGGHYGGAAGLGLGLGARPLLRAIVRNALSPGFTAPASRALVSGAERLSGATGDAIPRLGGLMQPTFADLEQMITDALRRPPVQVAQKSDTDQAE